MVVRMYRYIWKQMYIQCVQTDVIYAGMLRRMSERMSGYLYDSFKIGHLNGRSC